MKCALFCNNLLWLPKSVYFKFGIANYEVVVVFKILVNELQFVQWETKVIKNSTMISKFKLLLLILFK